MNNCCTMYRATSSSCKFKKTMLSLWGPFSKVPFPIIAWICFQVHQLTTKESPYILCESYAGLTKGTLCKQIIPQPEFDPLTNESRCLIVTSCGDHLREIKYSLLSSISQEHYDLLEAIPDTNTCWNFHKYGTHKLDLARDIKIGMY